MPVNRMTVDLRPLRASRDLRLLVLGDFVSGLGTQAALMALPYQVYVQTRSTALTGLLGAFELVPLITMALLGGALADRLDRRRLLLADQVVLVALAGGLAASVIVADRPPLLVLYVLGGLLAGAGALQNVVRSSIIPNVVAGDEHLRGAIAVNYGLYQLTMVLGPGLGGLLIAASGVGATFIVDAASCLAMVAAAWWMAPQPPRGVAADAAHEPLVRSIAAGLRYVGGNRALLGSFAIDLAAMTFGMPRALFPAMSIGLYHAGAAGTGALLAAVSAGATVAALLTGWLTHARRLGLIVIGAVATWGASIALAGIAGSLWLALALLAVAGAADSVSAVCRSVINQTVTPDVMRGRMSSVYTLVVNSGPRFGDIESGVVAGLTSVRVSVASGGIACIAGAALIVALFPALAAYDAASARQAELAAV